MNYLDIILCIPLLWGLYKGFSKGFIIQAASLLALAAGIYGAVVFSGITQEIMTENFQIDEKYLPVAAFAVTFIAIVIAVHFLGKLLEKVINMAAMGLFNKALGAIFGLLKYALILSACVFVFDYADARFHMIPEQKKNNSILYGPMRDLIPGIAPDANKFMKRAGEYVRL